MTHNSNTGKLKLYFLKNPRAKARRPGYFHNNPSCFALEIIINFPRASREKLKYNPCACRGYVCYIIYKYFYAFVKVDLQHMFFFSFYSCIKIKPPVLCMFLKLLAGPNFFSLHGLVTLYTTLYTTLYDNTPIVILNLKRCKRGTLG